MHGDRAWMPVLDGDPLAAREQLSCCDALIAKTTIRRAVAFT